MFLKLYTRSYRNISYTKACELVNIHFTLALRAFLLPGSDLEDMFRSLTNDLGKPEAHLDKS